MAIFERTFRFYRKNENRNKIWMEANSIGQELGLLKGHTAEVIALHYNDDGNQIITGSFDGTVNVWDTRTFTWV